jgi:hypothetical protein
MENFEGALNHIIKIMNVTEKEKVKRVEILAALEKKVARRLRSGQMDEAIDELKDIIDDYKLLGLHSKAQVLELTLNELLHEINSETAVEEDPTSKKEDKTEHIVAILEARSKMAIRRFLQGKLDDAITLMIEIIEEFRHLEMPDRAEALEDWMYRFLDKKLDDEAELEPISERLESDPALEEQLLSFRMQKILKRFIRGAHRQAVEEFTALVNEYKAKGALHVVETLEIWFNLFITRTYLIPSRKYKAKSTHPSQQITPPPPLKPMTTSSPSSPTVKHPPRPQSAPPLQSKIEEPPAAPKIPPSLPPAPPTKPSAPAPPPIEDKFREKIDKIKGLLKQFEESI